MTTNNKIDFRQQIVAIKKAMDNAQSENDYQIIQKRLDIAEKKYEGDRSVADDIYKLYELQAYLYYYLNYTQKAKEFLDYSIEIRGEAGRDAVSLLKLLKNSGDNDRNDRLDADSDKDTGDTRKEEIANTPRKSLKCSNKAKKAIESMARMGGWMIGAAIVSFVFIIVAISLGTMNDTAAITLAIGGGYFIIFGILALRLNLPPAGLLTVAIVNVTVGLLTFSGIIVVVASIIAMCHYGTYRKWFNKEIN